MFGNLTGEALAKAKATRAKAKAEGYNSGLETQIRDRLVKDGVPFRYEAGWVKYDVPERRAKYKPDFFLDNGIIIESKGKFEVKDRQKSILIKNQHPDLDIRFVFSNPKTRISKQSATTYGAWCESHGFLYAKFSKKAPIPAEWIGERPLKGRLTAMVQALGFDPFTTK